jgi:hypothetical protein
MTVWPALMHAIFEAVVADSPPDSVIALVWAAYSRAYGQTVGRRSRSDINSVFKWVNRFIRAGVPRDPGIGPLTLLWHRMDAAGKDRLDKDWDFIVNSKMDRLVISERCLLNGNSVSCNFKYKFLSSVGIPDIRKPEWSIQKLGNLNSREQCPTILSWFVGNQQCFGIPWFFFRLSYTSSCIDQAYACMLLVPKAFRQSE